MKSLEFDQKIIYEFKQRFIDFIEKNLSKQYEIKYGYYIVNYYGYKE